LDDGVAVERRTRKGWAVHCEINDTGDVFRERLTDGTVESVDPDDWGWTAESHKVPNASRLTIEEVAALPGFTVTITDGPRFVPGPKSRRPEPWLAWVDGAAPPACYESTQGASGYFDRLTTAMAKLVDSLPNNTGPYTVHDFVSGRRIEVSYEPPPVGPDGEGVVYILDDGYGLKVGHTTKAPISRIRGLQTGNPRVLRTVATIAAAAPSVEAHLHEQLAPWLIHGEWFRRDEILAAVSGAGDWTAYLLSMLPEAAWEIEVYEH
jgi:hypothetical protein